MQWERTRKREKLAEMEEKGELPDDVLDRLRAIRLGKGVKSSDGAKLDRGRDREDAPNSVEKILDKEILTGLA